MKTARFPNLSTELLGWYDQNARTLPWRISPAESQKGVVGEPYHIWLSEVMLQQTTVVTVVDYFEKFLKIWPDIEKMAQANEDEVLKAWAGLGYYSRARNLKKCADIVVRDHGGRFPQNLEELRQLPGIGDYTAAAIAAIAFRQTVPVVDGNIERIISRLDCIDIPLPKSKPLIRDIMKGLVPSRQPGDFVQAMMDIGATICTPRNPDCHICPLRNWCKAADTGEPSNWPKKLPKKVKPERVGAAFVAIADDGAILLEKRAKKGLLAGMSQVPTTGWTARLDGETGVRAAPFVADFVADWRECGTIRHTFTHFHLTLHVFRADMVARSQTNGWWSRDVENEALPTVFRKVIEKALEEGNMHEM